MMASCLFLRPPLLSSSSSSSSSSFLLFLRNYITSSDVTAALRPFYFLVHPDLFGRFPKEQEVNQNSMKVLKNYIDSLTSNPSRPPSYTSVRFYLRPRKTTNSVDEGGSGGGGGNDVQRARLKCVTIGLDSHDVRKTVLKVLRTSGLPTFFVDNQSDRNSSSSNSNSNSDGGKERRGFRRGFTTENYDEDDLFRRQQEEEEESPPTFARRRMDVSHPLDSWLEANVSEARRRVEEVEPFVLKATRIKDELCSQYGIKDIVWDTDWQKYTRINKLTGLMTLLRSGQADVAELLKDRVVIFSDGRSGITMDGDLALFAGEVLENWLWHIRQVPLKAELLRSVPRKELRLSRTLRDIRIVRRKTNLLTMVDEYLDSLDQLTRAVDKASKAAGKKSFQAGLPASLSEFEMSVETGESPMMVSQAGQIIAPCNIIARTLMAFIRDNQDEARKKMEQSKITEKQEAELMSKCAAELGLVDFRKADGLDGDRMMDCCIRLLQFAPRIRQHTHGNYLEVNTYYDLRADGLLCIPHFWLEEEQEGGQASRGSSSHRGTK